MSKVAPRSVAGRDTMSICYLLRRVHQQVAASTSDLLPDGRHPRDIALLRVIDENAPVSQQWLADYLAINRSVMVKLIDGLESSGDVVRDRRPEDRRSYALRLSPSGHRTIEDLSALARDADEIIGAPLTAAEHRRLKEILQRVVLPYFEPAPPPDLASLSGWLIAHAHIRSEAAGDERLAPLGLTVRTFIALAILSTSAPCSQQDLAAELDIGAAATVELVDELEQLGTVERLRNPIDRRSYALELTTAGEELLVQAAASLGTAAAEFTSVLSEAERSELVQLLAKLAGVDVAG